jgi:hypothetical protein
MKSVVVRVCLLGGLLLSCGGDSPPIGKTCVMNSECANPLSCTFGKCHAACAEARDCGKGELCVKSPTGAVCQQQAEAKCAYKSECPKPLTCAIDRQCRTECLKTEDCPTKTQKCIAPGVCAEPEELDPSSTSLKNAGSTPVPEIPDGGLPDAMGAAGAGGAGGGSLDANMMMTGGSGGAGGSATGGTSGNACTSPQTTFGNVAKGDANPNFTSGVGVRTGNRLLVVSGYAAAGGDAGTGASSIWVQAFELDSGKSSGPAVQLFEVPDAPFLQVRAAAVAPGGEVVVLHSNGTAADATQTQLHASFLMGANPGAGNAGVAVARTVMIESVVFSTPRVMWSTASSSFVASWQYRINAWFMRVRKFLPDGRGAGADTNIVPAPPLDNRWEQSNVGVSGKFLGVTSVDTNTYYPHLAILDPEGNPVGSSITLNMVGLGSGLLWTTVGGTSSGFVTISHTAGTAYQVFVPITATGAVATPDGGASDDGGAPPPLTTVTFASTASTAHMVSDGLGGTGAVLLEMNGASFLYVKADGTTRLNTGTVISSADGSQANISHFNNSFAVSLYEKTAHVTKVIASGCGP